MDNLPNFRQVLASPRGMIALILVILVIGSLVAVSTSQNTNTGNNTGNNQAGGNFLEAISPHMFMYASWVTSDKAAIKGLNLTTGNEHTFVEFPSNIKRLTFLPPEQFIYIDNTDGFDHGTHIARYSTAEKTSVQLFAADSGYLFDDYAVSRNGQYMAVWEIARGQDSLIGGKSRVSLINMNDVNFTKQLLADEAIEEGNPVFYPRAVSNDGSVVLDKWIANDAASNGRGFGYGMFLADTTGNLQEIAPAGTYSTQPILSPDGNYVAFAGYSGRKGAGTASASEGFRNMDLNPDQVMVYDLVNRRLEQQTDPIFTANDSIFPMVYWDSTSDKLFVGTFSSTNEEVDGFYLYDIHTKSIEKVALGNDDTPLATLEGDKTFAATVDRTTPGNLGSGYEFPYSNPRVFDAATSEQLDLEVADNLLQYLGMYSLDEVQSVLGVSTIAQNFTLPREQAQPSVRTSTRTWIRPNIYQRGQQADTNNQIVGDTNTTVTPGTQSAGTQAKDRLQLETYIFDVSLAPVRETQQSRQLCRDVELAQCTAQGLQVGTIANLRCVLQQRRMNGVAAVCYDSPLYLYGTSGTQVQVKAHTPVFNSTPAYDNGYQATLQGNGMFSINGNTYNSISYDYTPAMKNIARPSYGTVTTTEYLPGVVSDYARNLGLTSREAADLIQFARERVDSPYVFVSYFNQETSKRILPLTFVPQPDTYINYVFYFKKLTTPLSSTPVAPFFPPVPVRSDFTAVEISGLVE